MTASTLPPSQRLPRDWRRNCLTPEDKLAYLRLCGPSGLRSVFRIEVPADVLRDALAALELCWSSSCSALADGALPDAAGLDLADIIVQLLQALSSRSA